MLKAAEIINKNTFYEKNICYKVLFDKSQDLNVKQPFHTMLQVINNLIINSIKAIELLNSPERNILLKAEVNDNQVHIYIADTGIGIPTENYEKIFQVYFTTTGGSGIGLYHAKVALEEICGEICISEKIDNFTTVFKIKLPIENE